MTMFVKAFFHQVFFVRKIALAGNYKDKIIERPLSEKGKAQNMKKNERKETQR